MIKKIFKALYIVQTVSNEKRIKQGLKRIGKGHFDAHRFNPYNPLSYIILPMIFILSVICFGIVGVWKELGNYNPFKWD